MWLYDIKDEQGDGIGSEWAKDDRSAINQFMLRRGVNWGNADAAVRVKDKRRLQSWITAGIAPPAMQEVPGGRRGVIAPSEGWAAQTYYIVDVSMSAGNPVFRAILYSGFLSDGVNPGAYASLFWGGDDSTASFSSAYYLRALAHIGRINDPTAWRVG